MHFSLPRINLDWSEADLSHKWFSELARLAGYSQDDGAYAHYRNELRTNNSKGLARQDFTFFIDSNPLVHVELKAPKINLEFESINKALFYQAHKYAFSHYVVRRDQLITPMGILTNGIHAYVFDGSIVSPDHSLSLSLKLDLMKHKDLLKLIDLISVKNARKNGGFLKNEIIPFPVKTLNRKNITGADEFLAKTLCKIFEKMKNCGLSERNAFTATVTFFLTAILRDCGFIPTEELNSLEEKSDWQGLVNALEYHLNSELTSLLIPSSNYTKAFTLYNETRWLPIRLDIFPPDALGMAYEQLLHHVKGNEAKVCYYTPIEVIDDILNEIGINENLSVLDPCAGSSAFLTTCVEHIFPLGKIHDTKKVKKYIENKLVGIDKDWFAVQISKAALTAIYARYLPDETRFKAPVVQVHELNFFDYENLKPKQTFDRIVGNPPWGDHLVWAEKEFHPKIHHMKSYCDKTCISIYIFEEATKFLNKNGKIGMLLKHEVLDGIKHSSFRKFITNFSAKIWDYGRRKLFRKNGAQTIVVIGEKNNPGEISILKKDASANRQTYNYSGTPINQLYSMNQGFQSGCDKIYEHLAREFKRHINIRPMVAASQLSPFVYKQPKKYLYIDSKTPADPQIEEYCRKTTFTLKVRKAKGRSETGMQTKTIEWFLFNRAENVRKKLKSLAWLWVYDPEKYFKAKRKIFTPRYIRDDGRINAVGVYDRKVISKTDTTVLIPNTELSDSIFRFTLGFLN